MKHSVSKALICLSLFLVCPMSFAWTGGTQETNWVELTSQVATNKAELESLMEQASAAGMDTNYAYVSWVTVDLFQTYAQYDYDNPSVMSNAVADWWLGDKIPNYASYHIELPFDEMQSCLDLSSNAIVELQQQLATNIVLKAPLDLSTGTMTLTNDHFAVDGVPAIPSTFTWMPDEEDLKQAFGRMAGSYYQLTNLESDGTLSPSFIEGERNDAYYQTTNKMVPQQIFLGGSVASWMTNAYPEVVDGARNFVKYDTDSPQIRGWLTQLFEGLLPELCGPSGSADGVRMHLLANEPNFATREGAWKAENGVSGNTMAKYKTFLETRYTNDVAYLNSTYGTSYADFDAARDGMTMPISTSLQGGAEWYDWCRFNMDRINDYFEFLKAGTQANDPDGAPTTIKVLGDQFLSERDEGMDVEYLAKLMDVQGADNKVTPLGVTDFNIQNSLNWTNSYCMDWAGQSITLDFMRSVSPGKAFYDSEWHGLSTGKWRDFSMDPDYVRAAIWMAVTHGTRAMQAWYWPRDADGSLRKGGINAMIGSIVTLPAALDAYGRTFKELNAHGQSVVSLIPETRHYMIYHCDEAAIQDVDYSTEQEVVYEALKLLNVPVGFVTPSTFSNLSSSVHTVIVPPTHFIADDSLAKLQAFEVSGGNVVQISGPSASFAKDEHGVARSSSGLSLYTNVTYESGTYSMAAVLENALSAIKPVLPIDVEITNGGSPAYGVLALQSIDTVSAKPVAALINLSKDPRTVALSLSSGDAVEIHDLLTGQIIENMQVMQPYDVLLLEAETISQLPVVSQVVQWGEIGGDTGIVTNNQEFTFKTMNYTENTNVNPIVGADYYPTNINHSPEFNAAASSIANSKEIYEMDGGDIIRSGKNMSTYDSMYVWENLSGGATKLASLEAEVRLSMYGGTGTGVVHWIVQKKSGDWYASAGMALTQYPAAGSSFTTLSATDVSNLSWFSFTPITSGYGSVGASATIDMENIKSAGLYYDLAGSGKNIYADLRYFQAMGSSASTGWDAYVVDFGLTGNLDGDQDEDGQLDIHEYALGGNPTNPAVQGVEPSMIYLPGDKVSFYNLELTNTNSGITYLPEWTDNLVSNVWNSSWEWSTHTASGTTGYDQAERRVYGGTNDHLFFRLRLSEP